MTLCRCDHSSVGRNEHLQFYSNIIRDFISRRSVQPEHFATMILIASGSVLVFVAAVLGHIHFEENFDDDSWKDRWAVSTDNRTKIGKFKRTTYYGDSNNTGLTTVGYNKKFALATKFTPLNIANKTLVFQLSVKNDYKFTRWAVKLYDCNFLPSNAHKDTLHFLTFVPSFHGSKKLHINFSGRHKSSSLRFKFDIHTHVYTIIVESDMAYEVLVDGKKLLRGNIHAEPSDDVAIFSPICGIGLVFDQSDKRTIFDNILLTDDVDVAERKREEILHDMVQLEWFRTPWLVDIAPEDLTKLLKSNKSIEFKDKNQMNPFFVEFDIFLVPFNWSGNNTAFKAAAMYNKYHGASNESIQLWVSFQPRNENILIDIDSVLGVVNDANSIVAGTVTAIVINYGFLDLHKQTLPFVNHEIRKASKKLKSLPAPAPKLAVQMSDINCKRMKAMKLNLLEFLVVMPMPPRKKFSLMNELDLSRTLYPCSTSAKRLKSKAELHMHASIEINFGAGIYKHENVLEYKEVKRSGRRLHVLHAAEKTGRKDIADIKHEPMGKNLDNWLYQPTRFSKSHFGAVIRLNDHELFGSDQFASIIFESFQHIIIQASTNDSGTDDRLKRMVLDIANYSFLTKGLDNKEDHRFRFPKDNLQIQISILVTIDTKDSMVIERQVFNTISIARKANEKFPGTVKAIFFDWITYTRSDVCNKSDSDDSCWRDIFFFDFYLSKNYAMNALIKTGENTTVIIGSVFDKQFWEDIMEHRGLTFASKIIPLNDAIFCKSTVRHKDIVRYGGLLSFKTAVEHFSHCETAKSKDASFRINYYVEVIGCVGNHSNVTLLVEYARMMENFNGWAERENVLLFINAGVESTSSCNDNIQTAEETGCNCGWWIKQESHDKYQDKKTIARKLYEKAKVKEEKPKAAAPTAESLTWLWVLIPVVVFGAFFTIPATFLALHYRSKYILTKQDVDDFIKGRQATRAEPSAEGGETAETLSYNSEKYELCPSAFTIDIGATCLGTGEFGRVYPGSIRRDGQLVEAAVKMANTSLVRKSHGYYLALKGLLSEIKVLAYVGEHNHIVTLLGAYTKKVRKGEIAVFLELCQLGSLDKYLHSIKPQMVDDRPPAQTDADEYLTDEEENERGKIQVLDKESSDELFRWAGEIASGMEFLTSKKLVHADLATRNVLLLTADKIAKISDFGLSRRLYDYTEYVKQNQAPLAWRWMAPESLRRMMFNEKTDIWAFGVTLWEMFTLGDQPYPGLTWNVNFSAFLERGLRLPEPRFNLNQIYLIMMRCWDISPALRPTFAKLKCKLNVV